MEEKNVTSEFSDRTSGGQPKDQGKQHNKDSIDPQNEYWRDQFLRDGNDPDMFAETGKYIVADKGGDHLEELMKIQADANEKKQEINRQADEQTMNVIGTPEMRASALDAIETQRRESLDKVSLETSEHAKTYYNENFSKTLEFNEKSERERDIDHNAPGVEPPGQEPSMD